MIEAITLEVSTVSLDGPVATQIGRVYDIHFTYVATARGRVEKRLQVSYVNDDDDAGQNIVRTAMHAALVLRVNIDNIVSDRMVVIALGNHTHHADEVKLSWATLHGT